MGMYEDLAQQWTGNHCEDLKTQPMTLHVGAPDFVNQLFALAQATQDMRFFKAAQALQEYDLVDAKGAWRRDISVFPDDWSRLRDARAADIIDLLLDHGMSLRVALAGTAVAFERSGNSFDAAVKSLERVWRSQSPGPRYAKEVQNTLRQCARCRKQLKAIRHGFAWYFRLRGASIPNEQQFRDLDAMIRQSAARLRNTITDYSVHFPSRSSEIAEDKGTSR